MKKVPLAKPEPDFKKFVDVITGKVIPEKPPLIELFLDLEIVREISKNVLGRNWVEGEDIESQKKYFLNSIEVYWRMGYDCYRITGAVGLVFPGIGRPGKDTAPLSKGTRHWAEEGKGPISSWEDFESYPWPDPRRFDYWYYDFISKNLPDGMGILVCPHSGFLEIPLDILFGYENLCYLMYDNPELVAAVFRKVGEILYSYYEHIVSLPKLVGFFQGDDMGFKTATLVPPDFLRTHVLPWHKKIAQLAHDNGLIYLLHACGNLEQIMPNLIDDVKIDGRHSYEDEGNSVVDAKRKYGDRIAILGGIDVDKLARMEENQLRQQVRRILDICMPGGRYCLGSGNTVTNYVPIKNYFAMVEEGLNYQP
ncbi:MAG: uroporphyrinogen decarboxylase family protein [Candidatus Ratteibacteria bacterium]